jgi:type VI secretion system protein
MGREQTLLQRIGAAGDRSHSVLEPSASEDIEALMDSVRHNLTRLLNARHGLSEAMPDYGLPALTDLTSGSGDHVHAIEEAIRVAIEKYEPRLRRVQVKRIVDEDAPHTLSFRVDATLVGRSGQHRVFYETTVTGQGQYDVYD